MKNFYKISCILFVITSLVLIAPILSAQEIPLGLIEIGDDTLAEVNGMGQEFIFQEISSSEFSFRYSGNSGDAFKYAQGLFNVTNVSGDGNIVQNIIDLTIQIYNIDGDVIFALDDIMNTINIPEE